MSGLGVRRIAFCVSVGKRRLTVQGVGLFGAPLTNAFGAHPVFLGHRWIKLSGLVGQCVTLQAVDREQDRPCGCTGNPPTLHWVLPPQHAV